ncbi:MAG TPA: hypothetical protein VF642_12230 [Propionibacteriaceae bacterium]|jgi:hypothetical protein
MARLLYGPVLVGTPTPATGDGNALAFASTSLQAYRARTGGTAETDLQTVAGSPITAVVPDSATGAATFYGPDGYTGSMWLADPATGVRWQVLPIDIAERLGGTGLDAAGVRTILDTALVAGTRMSIAKVGNTYVFATTATTNQTDDFLRDLGNATGTLSADALVDGTTKKVLTAAERTKLAGLTAPLTDAQFNAKVKAYLDASGYSPTIVVGADEADPNVVDGATLLRLAASTAAKSAAELTEGVSSGVVAAAGTYALTPPATVADTTVYAHVITGQTAASVTGGAVAAAPSGLTGGGRTWTLVPNTSVVSSNSQMHSSVWKGVGANPTTANVVITVAAQHDRVAARLVGVTNSTGAVVQSTNGGSTTSQTPSATLSGVAAGNLSLAFMALNSGGAAASVTTAGFTELLPQLVNSNPAFKGLAAYNPTGVGSVAFGTPGNASAKMVTLLEVA